MSVGWIFNLDAERELADLRRGRSAKPAPLGPAARQAQALLRRPAAAGGWLSEGDLVLDPRQAPRGAPEGLTEALAWCPTPLARAAAEAAGLRLDGPSVGALTRANARETFADLDPLPGAEVVDSLAALRRCVERPAPGRSGSGRSPRPAWLLRRSLCCAGGGRLLAPAWDRRAGAWAEAALEEGPIEVQPVVDVVEEFSVHGRVDRAGSTVLGAPLQWAPRVRQVRSTEDASRLVELGEEVGRRLAALGYHGPFGADAFRWLDAEARPRLQVGTDVNARYTMHFSRGAPGLLRPASPHHEHLPDG